MSNEVTFNKVTGDGETFIADSIKHMPFNKAI